MYDSHSLKKLLLLYNKVQISSLLYRSNKKNMFIIVNCTPKVRHKTFGVLYSSANEYYTQVPLYYAQVPSSTILKCHRVLYVFSWFCLTLFGDINCNNWQVLTKCPKRLDSFVEATLKSLTILAAGHAEPRLVVWQGCAPLDGVLILMSRLPA